MRVGSVPSWMIFALAMVVVGALFFYHFHKESSVSDQVPGIVASGRIEKATFGAG